MFYKSNHNLKSLNCTKRLIHKHITRALKYLTRNPSDIHDKFHFWIFMGANQAEFHSSFHFALLWKKSESIFFSNFPNSLVAWDWDGDRHILDFMGVNWAVLLSSRWSGKRQSLASSNIKSLWRPPCPWKWNVWKWVIAIFMIIFTPSPCFQICDARLHSLKSKVGLLDQLWTYTLY